MFEGFPLKSKTEHKNDKRIVVGTAKSMVSHLIENKKYTGYFTDYKTTAKNMELSSLISVWNSIEFPGCQLRIETQSPVFQFLEAVEWGTRSDL